jgi:hydrogenase/urease accessory protein HupE
MTLVRSRTLARPAALLLTLAVLVGLPASSRAHPLTFTETTIVLRPDGSFQTDLICDLDALALGAPQNADDAALVAALGALTPGELETHLDRLRQLFRRRVRVRFDGAPVPFEVSFPDVGTPAATASRIPTMLGLTARLIGTVPAGATDMEFFASRAFADVHLTVHDEIRGLTSRSVLERGARSDPYALTGPIERPTAVSLGGQYLGLGFVHIVPRGLDHILFVLGLFLLGSRTRPLVWQVSAFTVAHAATLSLAVFEIVSLPSRVVEPLIALSLVYVAVENVLTARLTPWRPAIVFGFGLLHGLGFAGALGQLGLPEPERLLGLLSFNVGIELGQLLVIVVALSSVGWCRRRPWYRTRIAVPLSVAIAGIGLFWAVERMIGS